MLQDLNEAFKLVNETNNQAIKAGEAILAKMRNNINYPNLLFTCLKDSSIDVQKLRASIELRIWCESYKVYLSLFRTWKSLKEMPIKEKFKISKLTYCLLF